MCFMRFTQIPWFGCAAVLVGNTIPFLKHRSVALFVFYRSICRSTDRKRPARSLLSLKAGTCLGCIAMCLTSCHRRVSCSALTWYRVLKSHCCGFTRAKHMTAYTDPSGSSSFFRPYFNLIVYSSWYDENGASFLLATVFHTVSIC